ncbi:SDR family NAD(P)-dependent oxidoreductase [Chengkuizengella axinellae]|uniref:SDR family NAD(P)-dependent oxidoreductase n=1 Tax=Chengkuizengella axinellae TaxID=3064388 RepID=A0ABT9J010_9BACL|nr:SDR family NAD(P)-dependent oxidoreductase [Chengkuizengella sp. 2205SS18-9]MDP5274917.1 SDR family NAD(P)-dependent oxidoreductase [Chengkuizengella sp. 2205SS18-9]
MNEKSINDIFAVNVTGPTMLAAAAIPFLEETKGSIINLSSTYGSKAAAGLSLYGASKAAVVLSTKAVQELDQHSLESRSIFYDKNK